MVKEYKLSIYCPGNTYCSRSCKGAAVNHMGMKSPRTKFQKENDAGPCCFAFAFSCSVTYSMQYKRLYTQYETCELPALLQGEIRDICARANTGLQLDARLIRSEVMSVWMGAGSCGCIFPICALSCLGSSQL